MVGVAAELWSLWCSMNCHYLCQIAHQPMGVHHWTLPNITELCLKHWQKNNSSLMHILMLLSSDWDLTNWADTHSRILYQKLGQLHQKFHASLWFKKLAHQTWLTVNTVEQIQIQNTNTIMKTQPKTADQSNLAILVTRNAK